MAGATRAVRSQAWAQAGRRSAMRSAAARARNRSPPTVPAPERGRRAALPGRREGGAVAADAVVDQERMMDGSSFAMARRAAVRWAALSLRRCGAGAVVA